jgi:hypothetical protein
MSEDQSSSGAPIAASGDDSSKDTVAYETYRKAVSEAKKAKEEAALLRGEKEAQHQSALAEQGKWKEMAEQLQKDLKGKDEDLKKRESIFVQQNLKQTVHRFAKELGAIDQAVEEVFEIAKAKGLFNSIEVKDDYSVNTDQVKEALGELSKKSPWFFQKQVSGTKDVTIGNKPNVASTDFKSMPKDKLLEAYRELAMKGKN